MSNAAAFRACPLAALLPAALLPAAILPAALVLAACAGGEPRSAGGSAAAARGGRACARPPGDSAYFVATQEYLKGLQPKPRRFLSPVGTDSELPPAAFKAIQDAGPSYLYPRDPAGQKAVLTRLQDVGPWTALLLSWHGVERVGDTAAFIRLRGHFLIDEGGGQARAAPARRIRFDCTADRWRFTRTEEERVS